MEDDSFFDYDNWSFVDRIWEDGLSHDDESERWIYFIQRGEDGPIKIGISNNPFKRLETFQTASDEKLHIRGVFRGTTADEALLHQKFAAQRLRGEWFENTLEIRVAIEELSQELFYEDF
jgi:hypothetical protein